MKSKLIKAHMATARNYAELSHARRLHVGAIVVKDDRIISIGYNGMPAGWDNNCESKVYNTQFTEQKDGTWMDPLSYKVVDIDDHYPLVDENGERYKLITKPEVLHAETNAIAKLARSVESGLDADMFVTHAPCLNCAKLIYQSGIKRVFFGEAYRDNAGVRFLQQSGITVTHVDE